MHIRAEMPWVYLHMPVGSLLTISCSVFLSGAAQANSDAKGTVPAVRLTVKFQEFHEPALKLREGRCHLVPKPRGAISM